MGLYNLRKNGLKFTCRTTAQEIKTAEVSRSVQRLPSLTPTNNFSNQWLGKARFSLWKKKPSCVCVAAPVVPEFSACSRAEQSSVETESRRSASCGNEFISFSFHSFQIFLQEYSNQKLTQMIPAFWCDLDASAQVPLPLSTMPYLFTIIKATYFSILYAVNCGQKVKTEGSILLLWKQCQEKTSPQ